MMHWTVRDLEQTVRDLASERYGHVYQRSATMTCRYIEEDNTPGCIFGHALHRLGVSRERLREFDQCHTDAYGVISGASIRRVLQQLIVPEHDRGFWLAIVQTAQDSTYTWGDAVRHADMREWMLRRQTETLTEALAPPVHEPVQVLDATTAYVTVA